MMLRPKGNFAGYRSLRSLRARKCRPRATGIINLLNFFNALAVENLLFALHNPPDCETFFPGALEDSLHALELLRRDDQHHADTHVEGAEHFCVGDVAELLQMAEDRLNRPTSQG